jgi:hypothetical protein
MAVEESQDDTRINGERDRTKEGNGLVSDRMTTLMGGQLLLLLRQKQILAG